MIQLHTSAVFAKLSTILRPLGLLYQTISPSSIHLQSISQYKPTTDFAFAVTSFIVGVLFDDLTTCSQADITCNDAIMKLKKWQQVYKNTMALPSLSPHIYTSLVYYKDVRCEVVKLKFHIVQTMFAVLQSNTDNNDGFYLMASKILTDSLHMYSSISKFADTSAPEQYSILEKMVALVLNNSTQCFTKCNITQVMESLLSHFFNEASCYNQADCEFFFKMANQQYDWLVGIKLSIAPSEFQYPLSSMPIGMFKYYLLRILMVKQNEHGAHSTTNESCNLREECIIESNESHFLFNTKVRSLHLNIISLTTTNEQ